MDKVKKFTKAYWIFLVLGFIALLYTSSNTISGFGVNTKLLSAGLLAPLFVIFIFYLRALFLEAKAGFPVFLKKNRIDIVLMVFVAYYCGITVFRFFAGYEIFESLHYAGILFGSFALYFYIGKSSLSKEILTKNILLLVFMIDLLIVADYVMNQSFRQTILLINVLIVCCFILITIPICIKYLSTKTDNKFFNFVCYLHIFILVCAIFLSGSRLMLFVGLFVLAIATLSLIRMRKVLLYALIPCFLALVLLGALYGTDTGDTKLYVDKQIYSGLGITITSDSDNDGDNDSDSDNKPNAEEMIKQSDDVRLKLMKTGIVQIKKNILFGTGDVFYEYKWAGKTILQSSHNFIIETMVSFGLIGFILLVSIVLGICKGLLFSTRGRIFEKCLLVLAGIAYVSFGLLEPTIYNIIITPTVFCVFATFEKHVNNKMIGENNNV